MILSISVSTVGHLLASCEDFPTIEEHLEDALKYLSDSDINHDEIESIVVVSLHEADEDAAKELESRLDQIVFGGA